jgi:hypothetical protein
METERWRLATGASRLVVLAALAVVVSLWAAVAKARFDAGRDDVLRREKDMPRVRETAERILTLRVELGTDVTPTQGSPGPALIPFLERAAAEAHIPKEAELRIDPRSPKPVVGRPGLPEQEVNIELKQVGIRALVEFLVAAEKQFRALEIREVVLDPLPGDQAWSAQVLLVVPASSAPSATP